MDARRANFASRQVRAGPAPLASFEDLPSDELESPEDFTQLPLHSSSALDEESSNQFTPDSLTISSQSTPRIECDFDSSNFTLTPESQSSVDHYRGQSNHESSQDFRGQSNHDSSQDFRGQSNQSEYKGQSTAEMRTTSLSSLSREATPSLSANQKKGSAQSLGNFDSTSGLSQVDCGNTRKSSWANMFRGANQNTTAKTAAAVSESVVEDKQPKKKKARDSGRKEESRSKEKGKFLSFFKKKSNKKVSPALSPTGELIAPNENGTISECVQNVPEEVSPKVTNGSVSKGKENELPNNIELCPTVSEAQNDLGKINSERNDKIPDERKISRKLINISENPVEKEYNILSIQAENKGLRKISKTENIQAIVENEGLNNVSKTENIKAVVENEGLSRTSKTENIQAIVDEIDHESSESEITVEANSETVDDEDKTETADEDKETDFEAENLISQDMSELDEDSIIELRPMIDVPKQTLIPSRQQRLEVTTKPIDRPRSTTPINVAPLEAFIKSVSPTFVSKIEKIKLSLPGEQFVGRDKSPKKKKSSTRSWTDFCESGLHSPRMSHKRTDSEEMADPFNDGANFSSESADSNWAAFDSHFESPGSNGFVDSFAVSVTNPDDQMKLGSDAYEPFNTDDRLSSDAYEPFVADFTGLSCSCRGYGCVSCGQVQSEVSSGSEGFFGEGLHQSKALSDVDKRTFVSDGMKSYEAANDFDSQHRQKL